MDIQNYFKSLSREIDSLKNRIRHLIDNSHWLTDGEWKESVVRHVLRRQLPTTVAIGRGFVVTGQRASHQLDVLIHDSSRPVLFRDGDLVFVTPDAVLGIIEVKSKVNPHSFEALAERLAADINLVRLHPNARAFAAIMAFERDDSTTDRFLDVVARVSHTWNERIDFAALGDSTFLKYWHFDPLDESRIYESWHSYELPGLAPGYFVHNVIDSISPESVFRNSEVWFPTDGKEPYRRGCAQSAWATNPS